MIWGFTSTGRAYKNSPGQGERKLILAAAKPSFLNGGKVKMPKGHQFETFDETSISSSFISRRNDPPMSFTRFPRTNDHRINISPADRSHIPA
ncbi:hypothetical protein VTL71DRAFT_15237 [Oculimacula yallundae]|uniref:Uncharacterized protein n=1 Tax=Oculimacula yallundae TaxID=86028 RepID=A0ABR4CIB2_9HELO